ncbi:MAG: 7,8-didemethyl-8-hydroxy-5-deazariboflavin synthase CofG [Acidobacteria bacterium]|nr:7,8-didemethyl-8-hydroxy-5-deazariboflavin synthase CofG [Acidobacteriota bacterium]
MTLAEAEFDRAIGGSLEGKRIDDGDARVLIRAGGDRLRALLRAAAAVRDSARRRTITYSRKVFLPLTNLCRDFCGYCTFRRSPGEPGAKTMTPDDVMHIVREGERLDCKEALFSLGDKPELAFAEMRTTLARFGHTTTIAYLRRMCEMVLENSTLLPHTNPGVMTEEDLVSLREVSASMGIMLESASPRLLERGGPHHGAPDKDPRLRLRTIDAAGRLQIPFTTGILIGIGETLDERIDALIELRKLHDRYGHIQEIIIQNFRAKPDIRMRNQVEPGLADLARTAAVARLLFGGAMNIQAPPNLALDFADSNPVPSADADAWSPLRVLLDAGINDWGGISPLTVDHINPERPWPHIDRLRDQMRRYGYELCERLAVYPEFLDKPGFLADAPAAQIKTHHAAFIQKTTHQTTYQREIG